MAIKSQIQIKVCGLTLVDEMLACASLGVDAVGFVFYPKSPRYVTQYQAKEICQAVPPNVKSVGVFVNHTYSEIMQIVEGCLLDAVQLHGQESPELVQRLRKENLIVIKALFVKSKPSLKDVSNYEASAYLLEYGKGPLPGGNALIWNWEVVKDFGKKYPLILAGGLTPNNITAAIKVSNPDAVDVSSGVERIPGRKDLEKVKSFTQAVFQGEFNKKSRRIF
ncbi:MAG: phosphoribosylanthranilate isomerase [Desulfobacterales bacterium]|nr:phosphoribosylanthranilate isomerase [Desulfobacterales bacterium]